MYGKNPLCIEVDKMYRMYIEVMYNVQNVQYTGRPENDKIAFNSNNQKQLIKRLFTKCI